MEWPERMESGACGEARCNDGGGARVYGYNRHIASGTIASTRGRMVEGQYGWLF